MKFGLDDRDINKIQFVFRNYSNIEKAIIYGSRAMGNYRNGSDIDIALIAKEISLEELNKIENEIDDLLLPYFFDISDFAKISNSDLINHINRVGQVFYSK